MVESVPRPMAAVGEMTVEEIKTRADDAWECGDYKEMINLMAELICRLEKKR
jgi:hypothetical protein